MVCKLSFKKRSFEKAIGEAMVKSLAESLAVLHQ